MLMSDVGLCCHVDAEHAVEAKNGVCPVCAKRVGMDLVGHITMQHASLLKTSFLFARGYTLAASYVFTWWCALVFVAWLAKHDVDLWGYMQRKRRFQKIGSNSTLSILRKELHEGNLQSLLGGSQHLVSSSNTKPDPLLSSFMCNLPVVEPELVSTQPYSIEEAGLTKESSSEDSSHRNIHQSPLSDMEQEVRARRCEFVKGLLLSTFLDDN